MQPPYSNKLHIFIGPTLNGFEQQVKRSTDKFAWHAPIKRDDINHLMATQKPTSILIVDGYFHNCLAVGHREIREAIKAGWDIWGVSSMGAIRAAEMISLGMKGYGLVFKHFVEDPDFRDDEVTLLHGIKKPYHPVSEPLIHIRYSLNKLRSTNQITTREQNRIINILSSMWYGDRTLYLLKELLKSETKFTDEKAIENFISGFDKFRIKSTDFLNFINEKYVPKKK
jgi:hypothetical protein